MMEHKQDFFGKFTGDVSEHVMTVMVDDGVRRHLRFAKPGTYCMSFDLLTWPGHLCYTGDMGTYVFSRLPDMFEFFRGRQDGQIDFRYWAEKCIGQDRDGVREFSEERWRAAVEADIVAFIENEELPADAIEDLRASVRDEVLCTDSPEHDGVALAMDFRWRDSNRKAREVFTDFYEHRLDEFTPRFIWCAYALRWAIAQYDAQKAKAA